MDLQFPKTSCAWLHSSGGDSKNLEQTLELRLPDSMPDIGKVLCGYGQALVRSKQWSRDGAGVSGGVMAWVLYLPEDGSGVRSVECWIPFQTKWDVPDRERDGVILAECILSNVDARSLSARKLMVRATVGVSGVAMVENTVELPEARDLPEDVQVKFREYDALVPVEAGEKMVEIDESVPAPGGECPEKLLYYCLHPMVTDCKLMADRAVFRGTALGHTLYRGEDGQLYSWDFQLPFSQYCDLGTEYGSQARLQVTMVPTGLEIELSEDGSLRVKCGFIGQYLVSDHQHFQVIEDAYSTRRFIEMTAKQVDVPGITAIVAENIQAEGQVASNLTRVMDCAFFLDSPRMGLDLTHPEAELSGRWQVLGADSDGNLCCEYLPWQETLPLDAVGQGSVSVWQSGSPEAVMSGMLSACIDLGLGGLMQEKNTLSMVTGLTLGEELQRPAERPAMILRRVDAGSLWELAKNNATTVEKIMSANNLSQEPEQGSWLLIPVP